MFCRDLCEKLGIGLVSDLYNCATFRVCGTVRVYVDERQFLRFGEKSSPHRDRTAFEDADFQERDRTIPEPGEFALIDFKIMGPFCQHPVIGAFQVFGKKGHVALGARNYPETDSGKRRPNFRFLVSDCERLV
jgi:hypothetical protein